MFTSAELIEALRRRMRRSLRPLPPPGEFPPAWRDWFAAMAARPGRVTGATAADVIAVAATRVPPPRETAAELGRWQAFVALWRQDWHPASRDERWMRIAATSGSLLLHLLFALALVWLMLSRFWFPDREAPPREGEEHVLQVEYIGEGTPFDAEGGGAPEAPERSPEAAAASAARQAPEPVAAQPEPVPEPALQPAPQPPQEVAPPLTLPVRELAIEVPDVPAPSLPAPQELQVTVVDVADSRFAVPPPRELEVQAPETAAAAVVPRSREIEVDAPQEVRVPAPRGPRELELAVPEVRPPGVAVTERRIELAEVPDVQVRPSRGLPELATRESRAEAPSVRAREVPMPAAVPAGAAGGGDARREVRAAERAGEGEGRAAAGTAATAGGSPDAAGDGRSEGPAPGAGALAGRPPGALPSPRVSDDWGDSTRSVPGRQAGTPGASGLFDGDGRPRLADGGRVGGGLPPGTVTEDFENIDRHGTWLKRPPYDYEPTSFDRFWMPNESLLEEWVRKSITEVRIPIPGTSKTIRCVTVLLAVGGACDILDPNLQEQPAAARPPPDVPFKPELLEDQDSLGPRPAGG